MNRRLFLKKSAIGSFALSSSPNSLFGESTTSLTILHTNDMHSRIEPFPSGSKYSGLGGMARRASLIQKLRSESRNVLLLDSGDIFQGTPYFNFFGGEIEFKLMSEMKYDVSTIGNHDFDAGLDGLYKVLPHASFDFVCSNYDFTQTIMKDYVLPYKIIKKGGIRVGIFGLGIRLENLVSKANYGATKYLNPVDLAKEMIAELRSKKCDLIVCLSHLGYKYRTDKISDISLAEQVSGIDLILGGHTHSFLDEPVVVKNSEGHRTVINQVGFAGIRLGKIDLTFGAQGKSFSRADSLVIS